MKRPCLGACCAEEVNKKGSKVPDDKWERVRQIVREECDRIERNILAVLEKNGNKQKPNFVNGKWVGITEEQLEVWKAAYGAVDIEAELKKAAAWIVANPNLAPKSQHGRFLNTWLSRTQTQASIRSIPSRNEPQPEKKRLCAYCSSSANGSVQGVWACSTHMRDAIDGTPVPRMLGVVPNPVAGGE